MNTNTTTTAPGFYVSRIVNQMTRWPEALEDEELKDLKPQHGVNKMYGACSCWICRDADIPTRERAWLLDVLARHVVRMPAADRPAWLGDYALRHGVVNTNALHAALVRHGLKLGPQASEVA